jgi:hypothetical protein
MLASPTPARTHPFAPGNYVSDLMPVVTDAIHVVDPTRPTEN